MAPAPAHTGDGTAPGAGRETAADGASRRATAQIAAAVAAVAAEITATAAEPDGGTTSLVPQLGEALARASWRLRRASVKELAPLGLTFAQSRVLRILQRHGEPMRMGDLAARFEVAPRSATSMVDSLETAGLVQRQADPTDRRSVLVGLTPEGLALMERVNALRRESAGRLFGRLTPAQQEQLLALLQVLTEPEGGDSGEAEGGDSGEAGAAT